MDERASGGQLGTLRIDGPWNWDTLLAGAGRKELAQVLVRVLPTRRWFGSKARELKGLDFLESLPLGEVARVLIVRAGFRDVGEEIYQVPLAFAANGSDATVASASRWLVVESNAGSIEGVLYDALGNADCCQSLLALFEEPREIAGESGAIAIERLPGFDALRGPRSQTLWPKLVQAEQSNSSVIFGERLILKIFRRIETGLNPDFEISEFLTRVGFGGTPTLAGAIVYKQGDETWALAMLQAFVPNRGDAWQFTLDWLSGETVQFLTSSSASDVPPLAQSSPLLAARQDLPPAVQTAYGGFLRSVEQLARRTGEMHLALASDASDPDFAPEPFSQGDRRAYLERAADYARETWKLLAERQTTLSGDVAEQARRVSGLESVVHDRLRELSERPLSLAKIRIHGDYHLGQVLATGDDFVIIDFEGEPMRSIAERRRKQLALRDVAGMIRSLHYASRTASSNAHSSTTDAAKRTALEAWTASWYYWSSVAFLRSYLATVGQPDFLPSDPRELQLLLEACLLEKAVYELRYELNNRPDWVYLPLAALEELLG